MLPPSRPAVEVVIAQPARLNETPPEPAGSGTPDPAPMPAAGIVIASAVLPPIRPSLPGVAAPSMATSDIPAATPNETPSASADVGGSDAPAAGIVVASLVLPPIRPSLPGIAAASVAPAGVSAEGAIPEQRIASLVPPPRPAFKWDTPEVAESDAGFAAIDGSQAGDQVAAIRILPPERPDFPGDEPTQTASLPEPAPAPRSLFGSIFGALPALPAFPSLTNNGSGHNGIDGMITAHAKLNDVPEALVHRVVIRESKYNPKAIGRGGAMGLMQIKHATARALGYTGTPAGLLDAETNLTYAVKYLAGAYRTAGGDYDRAVSYYARGYYYASKQRGIALAAYRGGHRRRVQEADASPAEPGPAVASAPVIIRSAEAK